MKRNIYPGEEWIYFKIYVSPMSANMILMESINPCIQDLLKEEMISQWFFIRYSDPDFHIRLRMELSSTDFIGPVIFRIRDNLKNDISSGAVSKIQIDTYQREIERYGTDTMEEGEMFFCWDSEYVCEFLKQNKGDWHTIMDSVKWISQLYSNLGLTKKESYERADLSSNSYIKEFGLSNDQVGEINSMYRKNKQEIQNVISESETTFPYFKDLEWLKRLENNSDIVRSLIHMHCNRLFSNNQRIFECICYTLLKKAYQTMIHK